jgi:hypothetical protein
MSVIRGERVTLCHLPSSAILPRPSQRGGVTAPTRPAICAPAGTR